MKKLIYISIVALLMTACVAYRSLNLNRLTTGMTKAEVERVAGLPNRVLAVNETRDGYQEVLEYRTSYGDFYALEFWNDYLVGYEYIDSEVAYVPVVTPPAYYPDYGRPIIIIQDRPNRPLPPSYNRPPSTSRPPSTGRPPQEPSRPVQPTTKPAEGSRPVGSTSRPSSTTNQGSSSVSGGRSSSSQSSTTTGRQSSSGGRSSSSTTSTQSSSGGRSSSGSSSSQSTSGGRSR